MKKSRKIGAILTLVAVSLGVAYFGASTLRDDLIERLFGVTDENVGRAADLSHVLRLQMAVEFDGEAVEFDELLWCGGSVKGRLGGDAQTQVLSRRFGASRPVKSGDLLYFNIA